MTTFGQRLHTLRLQAGLSQGQLAGGGVSASYISLLESGKRSPSPEVVHQLAAKLGCSSSQLLEGQPSEQEQRILLDLSFARLALEHDGVPAAIERLTGLLAADIHEPAADEARLLLAQAYEKTGELHSAANILVPLMERCRSGQSHLSISVVGISLCGAYLDAGDRHRAISVGEIALEAARAQGLGSTTDYFRLAATVMSGYLDVGDFLHASTWAKSLIAEAEAVGERGGQAALYWNAAVAAEYEGRIDDALHLCQRAMAHLSELGNSRDLARLRIEAAHILVAAQPPRLAEALRTLDRTKDELITLGSDVDLIDWGSLRSTVALQLGEPEEAELYAREAVAKLGQAAPTYAGRSHLALSDALDALGQTDEADQHRRLALQALGRSDLGRPAAGLWREVADRLAATGDHATASTAYQRALDSAGVRDRSIGVLTAIRRLREVATKTG